MTNSSFPSAFGFSKLYIVFNLSFLLKKVAFVKKNSGFSLNWNSRDLMDDGSPVSME